MKTNGLNRFLEAQQPVYLQALKEVQNGRKQSHWMWFIFPQLKGLGSSPTAIFYGIENLEEAAEFLADPVLGNRLAEISKAVFDIEGKSANAIFGSPDDLKLRSSMTLFSKVDAADPIFKNVLQKYFNGPDDRTLTLLGL